MCSDSYHGRLDFLYIWDIRTDIIGANAGQLGLESSGPGLSE